jgi:hypothetical protein
LSKTADWVSRGVVIDPVAVKVAVTGPTEGAGVMTCRLGRPIRVGEGAELPLDPGFAVEVFPLQPAMARSATTMAALA